MSIRWEFQYTRQFEWLKDTRNFLYKKIQIGLQKHILEPGCSTALLTEEIGKRIDGIAVGVDNDLTILERAKKREKNLSLVCGDVYSLPFKKDSFDSIIFQFFLLWVKHPEDALGEMMRTLMKKGYISAIAEPDYGGRIDFPQSIDYSMYIQEKLKEEGADPHIGRKLEYLFRKSSLTQIQWGLSSIPYGIREVQRNFEDEWKFIERLSPKGLNEERELMRSEERELIKEGKRSYFMPVFYCVGKK
jgi:ubiquinone/menaquinone biosynthesis C-methylase UbiE